MTTIRLERLVLTAFGQGRPGSTDSVPPTHQAAVHAAELRLLEAIDAWIQEQPDGEADALALAAQIDRATARLRQQQA